MSQTNDYITLQEQEAKLEFMRLQTQRKYNLPTHVEPVAEPPPSKPEHVNFFKDLEEGAVVTNAKNKDHEQELKDEKEKYEKQIGYLTYLGQDTNEVTGKVSWYNKPRSSIVDNDNQEESDAKKKCALDPVYKFKHFFDKHRFVPKAVKEKPKPEEVEVKKKKHKKHKKRKRSDSSSSSGDEAERRIKEQKLRLLREQRLKREKEEKARADKLLAKMRGEEIVEPEKEPPQFQQKYNSQFNPHLAKQNVIK